MGDLSRHFNRSEFSCKCNCGQDTIDAELIQVLEDLRSRFEKPIIINSGNRCEQHNTKCGGATNSQHKIGKACDFIVSGVNMKEPEAYLKSKYPDKYGIGIYNSWIHLDVRKLRKRW